MFVPSRLMCLGYYLCLFIMDCPFLIFHGVRSFCYFMFKSVCSLLCSILLQTCFFFSHVLFIAMTLSSFTYMSIGCFLGIFLLVLFCSTTSIMKTSYTDINPFNCRIIKCKIFKKSRHCPIHH